MRASRQTKAPHAPEMKIPGARRSAFRPITEAELDVAVRELSSGTGPGDDEIRCEALKQLGGAAKKRVRRLFNFSLRTGQVPAERWHDATRPLLKPKGAGTLTNALCELTERIVKRPIGNRMGTKMRPQQVRLRRARSTPAALMQATAQCGEGGAGIKAAPVG
ncbi:hypothetical protein ERJ75_001436300 [Trypanosoma vivax]|nr:hypothetical protein ERJ75_001436300 [Trypanosoma vivax]